MSFSDNEIAQEMYQWVIDLFPLNRSLTGVGVRKTLAYFSSRMGEALSIKSIKSGKKVFDWTIPNEWTIRDAWVEDERGEKVIDFQVNNLHVIGYSEPVDRWLELEELQQHLYSLPKQPEAIPYVTSYYKRHWGFCLSHNKRQQLVPGSYRAVVDADLKPGALTYGELVIPGNSNKEVFLSTYVCHPSMANNELSGPAVTTAIVRWLQSLPDRRYTYRIVFIPETIGSLAYLSLNLEHLKAHVIAGFNVSCIGDDRCYSYLPSRAGNTLADRAARHALHNIDPDYIRYSWLDRGSDERQYCAPGVDLPVASIMRSKYEEYPEYHTSLDDLSFVTPSGLEGGYRALKSAIEAIEINDSPKTMVIGEPQLGKRGLYPTISYRGSADDVRTMMDLLTYADGQRDLIEIADLLGVSIQKLGKIVECLVENKLIQLERS